MSSRDRHHDALPDVSYTLDLPRAHPAGGTFVLAIVGDIDDHSAGLFEAGLDRFADQAGTLVVDLTQCASISSVGLRALSRRGRDLRDGASLVLVARDPHVLRLLELVDLGHKVPVFASVESALDATEAADRATLRPRPELGLVPPATAAGARSSGSLLGPGFRLVEEQPMYSSAWL